MTGHLVKIAVALPVAGTFTYRIPDHLSFLAAPGMRVLVPFGQRRVTGYLLGESAEMAGDAVKFILDILDESPLFPAAMIPFFEWIADYYFYPLGQVIQSALPGGLTRKDVTRYAVTPAGTSHLTDVSLPALQRDVLALLTDKPRSGKDISGAAGTRVPPSLLLSMEKTGWIEKVRQIKTETTRHLQELYVTPADEIGTVSLSRSQKRILETVRSYGGMPVRELNRRIPSASRKLPAMKEAGWIHVRTRTLYRDPFGETVRPDQPPELTSEQQDVVIAVEEAMGKGYKPFLLKGVTASGKTEVYLQLADRMIQKNRSVLVLVPEIALISQIERCFRARFGECVAILHSGLSAGERLDQWDRILRRLTPIVIGTRSAIFAPVQGLGLIVVDEEHDTSYKQDSGLHYHARDLALVRAKMDGAVALLGSATPSIQSYHHVLTQKFYGLTLLRRIEDRPLPETVVVDLRGLRDQRGIWKLITPQLHEAMKATLARGEQVLLFLNRRGFASFPVCAACGEVIRCKNCSISLTLHQKDQAYRCHYCGFSRPSVTCCGACGSSRIKLLGMGTEKIEAAITSLFPEAAVARMDRDTVGPKGALLKMLKDLRNRTTDILIGTQMVAKGHDFPYITLVGIICADLSFNFPDFRSSERMFQLLLQVSGRAGRGESPGQVILQTYNPEHFVIAAATRQDYASFYEKEIQFREKLKYPPFSRLIQIKISGKDAEKTRIHALKLGELCRGLKNADPSFHPVETLGPIESYLPRIARYYRWQILLKSPRTAPLRRMARELITTYRKEIYHPQVSVVFDVDPVSML
jgi:primosomal protein N' (replication factor Y)